MYTKNIILLNEKEYFSLVKMRIYLVNQEINVIV